MSFFRTTTSRLVGIAVVLLMIVALAGCSTQGGEPASNDTSGDNSEPTPSDPFANINRIRNAGVLRVGTSSGYFPFEMVDKEGNIIGFDMDMAKAIADALGVELEIVDMEFTGLLPALTAGKIDLVLAGMTITPQRALTVNFAGPYFQTGQAVLINREKQPGITSIEQLDKEGVIIAVSQGTTGHIAAERIFKKATIMDVDGSTTAGLAVLTGKADAMVFDQPWIAIYANQNSEVVYALLEPFTYERFGIAVAPGQMDLVYWLNTFLISYVDSLEYQQKFDYWFVDMPWMENVDMGGQ